MEHTRYTRQDIFIHKESRKKLIFNYYYIADDSDEVIFGVCSEIGTFVYKRNELEYLGRNTNIELVEEAETNRCYYAYGESNFNDCSVYSLNRIDKNDSELPFNMCVGSEQYSWASAISNVPFDELEDNLFNPFEYPNDVMDEVKVEIGLVKQQKALL